MLTIVEAPQRPFDSLVRVFDEGVVSAAGWQVRELHEAPALGHVHVDRALGAPDPVVFR